MDDATPYALRPMQTPQQASSVSAVEANPTRVYLSVKELSSLALKHGDPCVITSSTGAKGLATAWSFPSGDKTTGRIAKISHTLKNHCGFTFSDGVTISKATPEAVAHADKVYLADLGSDGQSDSGEVPAGLLSLAWTLLYGQSPMCESRSELTAAEKIQIIIPGLVIEIPNRKAHVPWIQSDFGKTVRRFMVKQIDSHLGITDAPAPLYLFDSRSKVSFCSNTHGTPIAKRPQFHVSADGIGGLDETLQELNFILRPLNTPVIHRNTRLGAILLFGPEGTGKTMIIEKIALLPWKNVTIVDSTTRTPATLKREFQKAKSAQPSLVVIDNLDSLAGKSGPGTASGLDLGYTISEELDAIRQERVIVIATTTRLSDVPNYLRTPGRFRWEIGLPVPDKTARIAILRKLEDPRYPIDHSLLEDIGERTSGYVGQDLLSLYDLASRRACNPHLQTANLTHASCIGESDPAGNDLGDATGEKGCRVDNEENMTLSTPVRKEDFEFALGSVTPTAMRGMTLETPTVHWTDIGGAKQAMEELQMAVIWPIRYPEVLEKLRCPAVKGILLYGPPGCAKTLLARALASECDHNFFAVKGAELTSMYVGETERAIREVFRKARTARPSIIFFDEIDAIGSARNNLTNTNGLNSVTTLLNEMDGIEDLKGVLVVGATNRPEILDSALRRPGRFDRLIYLGPPDLIDRKAILTIRMRGVAASEDVDLERLAGLTAGYTGAEIVNICQEASTAALKEWQQGGATEPVVHMRHLLLASAKQTKVVTDEMVKAYEDFGQAS